MASDIERLLPHDDVERGGKDFGESITNDFSYRNNVAGAAVNVRLGFIRKVYSLLAFQLAITVVLSSVSIFVPPVRFFIVNNDWMILLAIIGTFGTLLALFVYRRQHPHNLILLTSFTVVESYSIAVIISRYDAVTVLQAFFITFIVVVGLTLYTLQTKRDFTTMGAGLSVALLVLILAGFMQIFIGGTGMEFLISGGGAFLFSLFIIYDTQLIMQKMSSEEYILATISLYLDIINLFLYILRIIAETRRQ